MADRNCCLLGSCKLPLFKFSEELLTFVRLSTVTGSSAPVHLFSCSHSDPWFFSSPRPYSFTQFSPLCKSFPTSVAKQQSLLGPVLPSVLLLLVHGVNRGPVCTLPLTKLFSGEQVDG